MAKRLTKNGCHLMELNQARFNSQLTLYLKLTLTTMQVGAQAEGGQSPLAEAADQGLMMMRATMMTEKPWAITCIGIISIIMRTR